MRVKLLVRLLLQFVLQRRVPMLTEENVLCINITIIRKLRTNTRCPLSRHAPSTMIINLHIRGKRVDSASMSIDIMSEITQFSIDVPITFIFVNLLNRLVYSVFFKELGNLD